MSTVATILGALVTSACFCSDESACKPLTTSATKEVVAFSSTGAKWRSYNMTGLTTIVVFGEWDREMLCVAHAAGVKVVQNVYFDKEQLGNATYSSGWVESTAQMIKNNFTDGINFDIEKNTAHRDELTQVVNATARRLKLDNPIAQVTFDTAIYPNSNSEWYDYVALNKILTFFIPMAYDMCWGTTIAKPNSPTDGIIKGIQQYTALGIDSSRLVLGLPWYGWDFVCKEKPAEGEPCAVVSPFGGASWQKGYDEVLPMIKNATTTPTYAANDDAVWFNLEVEGVPHQVYYDDPKTLSVKVSILKQHGLMGAAIWNTLMAVNLPQDNPMWEVFCSAGY